MARAHYVKTSRKAHQCHAGHEIPIGEGYYWAAPGFRSGRYKKFACTKHRFRPSQLTSSLRSEPLAAMEAAEDAITGAATIGDIEAAMEDLSSAMDDYLSTRQEALDQWENGNSQLEEFVYQAETAQQEVEGWEPEYADDDEPDEDDLEPFREEAERDGDPYSREDLEEQWRDSRLEEVRESALEVIGSLDV